MSTTWHRLTPYQLGRTDSLTTISSYLVRPETATALAQHDLKRQYPSDIRQLLHQLGLSKILAPPVDRPPTHRIPNTDLPNTATIWHMAETIQSLTAVNGSLAISCGVNLLGMLPTFIAGSDDQVRHLCQQIHAGAYCALALTEIAHGSNLLATQTEAAEQQNGEEYLLTGGKQLINGGSKNEIITVLARTPGQAGAGAFSLFRVERDTTVTSSQRWHTLPMPAADISSISFSNTPASLLGRKGRGFELVQKSLTITRGLIGAGMTGVAQCAMQLATRYAHEREINGRPILHLNPIADHLLKMRALELLITTLSVKTCAMLNRYGPAAVIHASAAKLVCCDLAEELVTEGRKLHGARALMHGYPYHALVRDVVLYGTFDGTSHIVLDQIQSRLAQLVSQPDSSGQPSGLDQARQAYECPPKPLIEMAQMGSRPIFIEPNSYLAELAPHVQQPAEAFKLVQAMVKHLFEAVKQVRKNGRWEADQSLRHALAQSYAELETLIALIECTDSGCRAVLGMRPITDGDQPNQLIIDYALYSMLDRIRQRLAGCVIQAKTPFEIRDTLCKRMGQCRTEILENRGMMFMPPAK